MSCTRTSALTRSLAALIMSLIAACASQRPPPEPTPLPAVGEVTLRRSEQVPEDWKLLDIGVLVFSNQQDTYDQGEFDGEVFTEIRDNERHLLPFLLRNVLIESDQWGAIRVLPQADPSVDLLIEGTILDSDGSQLAMQITVTDSTGREWLRRTYRDTTTIGDYPEATDFRERNPNPRAFAGDDPFADLYEEIANNMLRAREALSEAELREIRRVSEMTYAADLSPESFSHNLVSDEEGRTTIVSLPAANDPMMARVRDMRLRHHLFIDTVDEYYKALFEETRDSYLIWRRYSFDQIQEEKEAAQRAADQRAYSSSAGYQTLRQRYDRYRWSKIYEQEFRELASGFNRETAPAILELNRQVHGLSGTMEEQYLQWRRILRQLFALETGTTAP